MTAIAVVRRVLGAVTVALVVAGCGLIDSLRPAIEPLVEIDAELPTGIVIDEPGRDRVLAAMPPGGDRDAVAAVSLADELLVVVGYDGCGLENPRLRWSGDDHLYSDHDSTGVTCYVAVAASAVFTIDRQELADRVTVGGSPDPSPSDPAIEDQGARVVVPRVFPTARLVRQQDPDAPALALIAAGTSTEADRVIAENRLPREHVDPGAGDALFVVRHHGCGFRYQLILYEDRARLFVDLERIGRPDDCRYDTVEVAAFVVPAAVLPRQLTFGVGPDAGEHDVAVSLT